MSVNSQEKQEIIKTYGKSAKDTGSVEVQIAILTQEIKQLTTHLQQAKKDFHSRIGIYKKSSKRNRLLAYLRKEDENKYFELIAKLGIRSTKQ